jgi:hypothetical protein
MIRRGRLPAITVESPCQIYMGEIPYRDSGHFWVSFESDPQLTKTRENIYGRCLPCIQNLYYQLQEGRREIKLGSAYHCWKVTAVVKGMDECLNLLSAFGSRDRGGPIYGKFGSGRAHSESRAVVFHVETERDRDRIKEVLGICLPLVDGSGNLLISRACAVLYEGILGDWRDWWGPVSPIKHPERVSDLLKRIRKTLFWSNMD